MRLRAAVDGNQREIVETLRKMGMAVIHLHQLGAGIPDLLVSSTEHMWLIEVKEKKGAFSEAQKKFYERWKGKPITVIRSVEEAIEWVKGTGH